MSEGSPFRRDCPALLVSVRSAEEGLTALEGGADLIDVKEPARGSLGRADMAVIADVLKCIDCRKPVSAAWGELLTGNAIAPALRLRDLRYVKWGLAGHGRNAEWPRLLEAAAWGLPMGCRPVAVGYADWQRAEAPPPADVCAWACERQWGAFLLDTWRKDGKTSLSFLALAEIADLVRRGRAAGVPVALAGSLGWPEIEALLPLAPTWFAVRGAVCRAGHRNQVIDPQRVRHLSDLLARSASEGSLARASG